MVIDDIIICYYAADRRRGLRRPAMTYLRGNSYARARPKSAFAPRSPFSHQYTVR